MADDRHALPFFYSAILVAELAILATIVSVFGTHPPFTYELGWAAVGSFAVMQIYSVRRRIRLLRNAGSLDAWLDMHIFLGLQGLLFVGYHCVGVSAEINLATINAGVVMALVLTGILGRYITRARTQVVWSLLHRPLVFVLAALTTLHVLAHFAYST